MPPVASVSPIMAGLMDHRVSAQVKDLDHYRIHGGMAVETDYIIHVNCVDTGKKTRPEPDFETFITSKTFSAFRTLADQLRASADSVMSKSKRGGADMPVKVLNLAKYCENLVHLIESQRTQYLGKVNYMYVKVLSKQRSQIITDVLDTTLSHFPDEIDSHPFLAEVAKKIEAFFLTDHCQSCVENDEADDEPFSSLFMTPIKKNYRQVSDKIVTATKPLGNAKLPDDSPDSGVVDNAPPPPTVLTLTVRSPVVPYTRKLRRSEELRAEDEMDLNSMGGTASLLVDDDRTQADLVPSYDAPIPTVASSVGTSWLGTFIDNNPFIFMGIFAIAMQILRMAGGMVVTIDLDILLLVAFASFCLGLHTPRPMVGGVDKPPLLKHAPSRRKTPRLSTPTGAAKLLRRSMICSTPTCGSRGRNSSFSTQGDNNNTIMEEIEAEVEEDEVDIFLQSPMPKFPEDAPLGSMLNCWSVSPPQNFQVRGDKYLTDKKKVPSGPCLFQARGIDLFLTDDCPENVGSITGIMGGALREATTFLINFRLPWGVLIFYYEIPERFVPFIKGCYGDHSVDKEELEEKIKNMDNNQDRCCARFLLGDDDHKNNTLKIIPTVVEGPWVVKSVVGGKPAIIGNKLPVNYVYEPESQGADGTKQELYLEADLDIVSSSAARGVLAMVRTYTQDLTLDLGFAIQGNRIDELREQMLVATRLHGIDPLNAPALPPMKDKFMSENTRVDNDETDRDDD